MTTTAEETPQEQGERRNPPGLGGFLCFVEVVAWDTYLAIYQKQTAIKLKPS